MLHTVTFSSQEFTIVAEKLVTKGLILMDTLGWGFVSMYKSEINTGAKI